jgi:hypothetical protein
MRLPPHFTKKGEKLWKVAKVPQTSAILADVCKKPIGYLALVVQTVGHQTTTLYSYHTIYFGCPCQCELSECKNLTISIDGSFIPWFIIS